MPGKRPIESADYVTRRSAYRSELTAVDAGGPQDLSIPELDTEVAPSAGIGLGQSDVNQYGRNAQIDMAIIVEGFSSVTVQAWMKANITAEGLTYADSSSSSSSAAATLPATGEWVKVDEKVVATSALWVVKDVPPGQYKFIVSAATGSGHIQLREQHAS